MILNIINSTKPKRFKKRSDEEILAVSAKEMSSPKQRILFKNTFGSPTIPCDVHI